jgi:hypothetical protein
MDNFEYIHGSKQFRVLRANNLSFTPNNGIIDSPANICRDLSGTIFLCKNDITILLPENPRNGCFYTFLKNDNCITTIQTLTAVIKRHSCPDNCPKSIVSDTAFGSCTLIYYDDIWYLLDNNGWD